LFVRGTPVAVPLPREGTAYMTADGFPRPVDLWRLLILGAPDAGAETRVAASVADTASAAALALPPVVRLVAHLCALSAPPVALATPFVADYDALSPSDLLRRVRVLPVSTPQPNDSLLTSPPLMRASLRLFWSIETSSYFVTAKQKQSSYTGKQHRGVVCALPFMVDALFGDACGQPIGPLASGPMLSDENDAVTDRRAALGGAGARARRAVGPAGSGVAGGAANVAGGAEDGYDADNDDEVTTVTKGFKYDWGAYRAAFGDMPVHRAVTSMFAEYASLYSRIAGQVTMSFPPPMTVEEGADIGAQATRFVNNFVTPLLGKMNSTKVHRLLAHVCQCIKYHGNLKNGNTGPNEAMHKADKAYYLRTNKNPKTFTFQLVRHAQGARAAMAKLEEKDKERARVRRGAENGGARGRRRRTRAARGSNKKAYHLKRVPVGQIAQRPGLARLAAVLGVHPEDKVHALSRLAIDGVFDCGGTAKQLLRSAEEFRGASWYDSVLYRPVANSDQRCVGEVRAVIRSGAGDLAVIMEMAPADTDEGCPLAKRGCQRLRWLKWDGEADCAVRVVPIERVIRVVHVVPDFADLASRRGFGVLPAARDGPLSDRLAMRYWLNTFYPWDV